MRDLEFAWATFLTRGMEQGAIPQADPRLLARAVLGLYNSVWHWYRPKGSCRSTRSEISTCRAALTMAGLTSVDGTRLKPGTPRKRQRRAAAA